VLEISEKQTNQISEFKYLRNSISSEGKIRGKYLYKQVKTLQPLRFDDLKRHIWKEHKMLVDETPVEYKGVHAQGLII